MAPWYLERETVVLMKVWYKGCHLMIGDHQYIRAIELTMIRELTEDEVFVLSKLTREELHDLDDWMARNNPLAYLFKSGPFQR